MPRPSHICLGCGLELSRVAPDFARLGLPVVVCPRCATAVVRRVHPLVRRRRDVCHLGVALLALGAQVLATILLTGLPTSLVGGLAEDYRLGRLDELGAPTLAVGALVLLAAGAWMGAMLRHWPAPLPLAVWSAAILLLLWWQDVARFLWLNSRGVLGEPDPGPTPDEKAVHLVIVVAAVGLAAIGMAAARRLDAPLRAARRRRFLARLKSRRKPLHDQRS
ncbi:MAG TPA: hypothetical protein VD963_05125 [Phycisphaerales bacterium]|nr:hypothetical protein [Phycisphaerales bacterium]